MGRVTTVCYGQRREWPSRKEAMDFFEEGILGSEGSEQERYVTIYFKLKNGATEASDES